MAKILVTGGAGFIGSHVVEQYSVKYGIAKVGGTRHIHLGANKIGRELGWAPTLDLEQGLEKTVAYFRERLV